MEFDDVFEYIGSFGAYQFILFVLLGLTSFFSGFQNMGMTIIGMDNLTSFFSPFNTLGLHFNL